MTDETNRPAPVQDRHREAAHRAIVSSWNDPAGPPHRAVAQALADAEEEGRRKAGHKTAKNPTMTETKEQAQARRRSVWDDFDNMAPRPVDREDFIAGAEYEHPIAYRQGREDGKREGLKMAIAAIDAIPTHPENGRIGLGQASTAIRNLLDALDKG